MEIKGLENMTYGELYSAFKGKDVTKAVLENLQQQNKA